jgi:hypothetical protein
VIIAVIFLALRGWYGVLNEGNAAKVNVSRPSAQTPEPRLQVDEVRDLGRLQRQEESNLTSYGWVDRKAGVARIPIEEAMQIVAQRGLPAPPPGPGKTRLEMRQEKATQEKSTP